MHFSIARFVHNHPPLPCLVGGQYWLLGERHFLRSVARSFELTGPAAIFAGLKTGDQVVVRVIAATDESLECASAEALIRVEGEPATVASDLSLEFARFVQTVRDYFLQAGLSEVHTPSLVRCPGLEPSLEPFALEGGAHFLPTSPEIHLKKALTQGLTDIFEIKPCFRCGEFSPHHAPEFLMLEWYRAFADLELILADLRGLLKCVTADESIDFKITTFRALFDECLQFELRPETSAADLAELCDRVQVERAASDTFGDLFHRLLLEKIEPALATMGPVVIRDFPPSQAALARITSEGWGDRFELYWNGLEIANAFNEVTDSEEQIKRWQKDSAERSRLGTRALAPDSELIEALRQGMPPTGGIALGMERLFMACRKVGSIQLLRIFPMQ